MKRIVFCASCALAAFSLVGAPFDRTWIRGTTDRDPLAYKAGEPIVFTLAIEDAPTNGLGEVFYAWKRTGDDGKVESGKAPADKPFVYTTRLEAPGFVRLEASVVDKLGKPLKKSAAPKWQPKEIFFDGGAGADVEALRSHPEPKDFDAFWTRQFARLERVPMKADLIEITSPGAAARLWAVRVDCAGLRPVTGYLSVPKAVEEGQTFPACLETHGYTGDGCLHARPSSCSTNTILLNINAHGLKLVEFGATEADTKALRWETRSHDCTYAFDPKQNADPEIAYFNGMVLRVKRALQYLKTVKGWNGKDLVARGGSQGGLQTIWAAACGEGVTRAESAITWCCDMYTSGKLRLDPALKMSSGGWYIAWTDALGYYDAANFARRIPRTCHTVIPRAGLGDYICPPTGLMKMWHNIPGNKEIHWVQGSQHGYVPPAYEGRDFVRTQD